MFSHVSVILFTIGLMDNQPLLILVGYSVTPCYSAIGTHPTGMLSCLNFRLSPATNGNWNHTFLTGKVT